MGKVIVGEQSFSQTESVGQAVEAVFWTDDSVLLSTSSGGTQEIDFFQACLTFFGNTGCGDPLADFMTETDHAGDILYQLDFGYGGVDFDKPSGIPIQGLIAPLDLDIVIDTLVDGNDWLFWSLVLAENDTFIGGPSGDAFISLTGNDLLYGNGGDDWLFGNEGRDEIYGNQGEDDIYGNMGSDTLFGGQDADDFFGGQDGDFIYGNLGNDIVYGNLGNDNLFGGQGDDVIYGGPNDDILFGNLGSDILIGNKGNDQLVGGADNDTFVFAPGSDSDIIWDFQDGLDQIQIHETGASLSQVESDTLITLDSGDTILVVGISVEEVSDDLFLIA